MNTKAKIRDGILHDIVEALTAKNPEGIHRSCLSCVCFRESDEMCMRFSQRPPARVIVLSCQHYEDNNDIPF